jgi:hypothetical protein
MTNDAIKKLKETEDELLRILPKLLEKTGNQKIELKIKASNTENLNGLITLINSRNVNSLLQRIQFKKIVIKGNSKHRPTLDRFPNLLSVPQI